MNVSEAPFALSAGGSAYPRLWNNLRLSFFPNVGAINDRVYDPANRRFVPKYTDGGKYGSPFGGVRTVDFTPYTHTRGYLFTNTPPWTTGFLEFSVSAWVRRATNAKYDTIFSSQRTNGDTNTAIKFRFNEAADTATIIVNYDSSNKRILANAASRVVAGQWAHVAMVFKQQKIYYYANGTTRNETNTTITGTVSSTTSTGMYIGHDHPATFSGTEDAFIGFNGNLGEVLIYNRALSSGEVALLASGASPFTPAQKRAVAIPGSTSAKPWHYYQQLRRVA